MTPRLSCAAFAAPALSVQAAFAGQGAQGRHAKIDRALADALASGEKTTRVIYAGGDNIVWRTALDFDNVVWGINLDKSGGHF